MCIRDSHKDALQNAQALTSAYANQDYVGQYNSNPILLSESGNMLLVSCGDVKPLGRTVMEGFNAILGDV